MFLIGSPLCNPSTWFKDFLSHQLVHILPIGTKMSTFFANLIFLKLLLGGWIGDIGIHELWKIVNYKVTLKMLLNAR